ncbi:SseB family protein [Tessaracoccus sp. OS52]|uniref:SseB family protein n=1 Tax=Tessaracoccus sp. OS52 TaxID=2886691 RepID=UPI001D12CDB5|nr:SseB family protein [Tessaracoccus sp. OS52]MCC2593203.1 SseB family protein [Tessaracoccus sp. OS52]
MDRLSRLAQPSARFDGDRGEADPITRAAIAAAGDHVGYIRALVALCTTRLMMPVVAAGDETMTQDPDRQAELAAVTLTDGTDTALLAFTGIDAMEAWQPGARPVLCHLDELAATVEPSGATQLLIDVAGPVPFVLAGEALSLIAQGYRAVEFEGGEFAWVRPGDQSSGE